MSDQRERPSPLEKFFADAEAEEKVVREARAKLIAEAFSIVERIAVALERIAAVHERSERLGDA